MSADAAASYGAAGVVVAGWLIMGLGALWLDRTRRYVGRHRPDTVPGTERVTWIGGQMVILPPRRPKKSRSISKKP